MKLIVSISLAVSLSLTLFATENVSHGHSHESAKVIQLNTFEVVSTATRSERLASEIPIRAEVASSDLLFSAGVANLSTAIDYIPGARTEANCQNCGTAEVKLLGLGTGYNQILFDSQPHFSGLASVYGLEHVPTSFVERIEVIKGGASSLYGPGAVAGIVNIKPRQPFATRIEGETTYESFKGKPSYTIDFVADYSSDDSKLSASLFGLWNESDAVDLNDDGFSEITEKTLKTLGFKTWFDVSDKGRVSIDYAYTDEIRRGGDSFQLLPHASQIAEALVHEWNRGGIQYQHIASPTFNYHLGISISDISRDSYYGGVGDVALPGQSGFDATVYAEAIEDSRLLYGYTESKRTFAEAIFNHEFGEHYLTWGAQSQQDRVFDEKRNDFGRSLRSDGALASFVGEDPIADDSFDLFGILLQDEWTPNGRWTVISGMRADKHSELDDWIVSPRFAVRHTLNPDWILRGSIATGFRAPEIFDEDFHIEILDDPTRTRSAHGLKEESSVSTAAGFIWTPQFANNRLQADVEFFQTRISDTFSVTDIVTIDADGNAFKLRENAGSSRSEGMEANLLYRFSNRIKGEIGFSYVDASFNEAQEILPGVFEKRFIETPRLTGLAQLSYEIEEVLDVFLGVIYTGDMIAVEETAERVNYATDDFYVVDLTLAKHFNLGGENGMHVDLLCGIRNLFDERQPDLTTGPNRDTTYFYGPRFPRSYQIKARVHF